MRDAWLEINLDNLKHNLNLVKNKINTNVDIMAVIKADAYGHGYEQITKVLINEGVNNFAFATLSEAIEFKKIFKNKNAMILGICPFDCENLILEYDIEQAIQSYESAKKLDKEAKKHNKKAKVHLNIDTGMSRFGFINEEKSLNDLIKVFELDNLEIKGIFTHFSSSADDDCKIVTKAQMLEFQQVLDFIKSKGYKLPKIHVSNSGAILLNKEYNFDMVRMGIITYGLKPANHKDFKSLDLKPLMSLKARIVRLQEFNAGRTVGYSRTYTLEEKQRIATLPLGYADGLRAGTDNEYRVYLNGQRHHLAGRICMDAMMIRVNEGCDVSLGDEVTLFGNYGNGYIPMEELSDAMGFINYELATGLKLRLKRYYILNGKIINKD